MNPFIVAVSIIQIVAMIYEFYYGNKYVGGLYLCYSIANILLILISLKLK